MGSPPPYCHNRHLPLAFRPPVARHIGMPDRFPLRHGPYKPPACQVGDTLTCALRGELIVVAFTDAPVPWPRGVQSGTESATPAAHYAAQQGAAPIRTESQTSPENKDGEAVYASPCEPAPANANLLTGVY